MSGCPDRAHLALRFSLVAEEIGDDFENALRVAKDLGLQGIEFAGLWGDRIDHASLAKLIRAKALLEKHGIQVVAIAPDTFKTVLLGSVPLEHIHEEPHFRQEMQLLRAELAVARFFNAPLARVFSFRREGMIGLGNPSPRLPSGGPFPEEMQEKVAYALALACREAEEAGIALALENVRSCWGNTGHNTAVILERVDSHWLKGIWDPANDLVSGAVDSFQDGYEAVKPYIAHVHLKDAVVEDEAAGLTRWERIGDGSLDVRGQIDALMAQGFGGYVSIETHWTPPGGDPESNTRRTHAGLMAVLDGI